MACSSSALRWRYYEVATAGYYPLAALVLTGFIAFMSYRLSQRWSDLLLGFALFDLLTLALVINEWVRDARRA